MSHRIEPIGGARPLDGAGLPGAADFPVAIDERYFEDYLPGSIYEYGQASVTEDEIIEFALRFDPQPIHTDPVAAASGPFGGLIASGWHTAGIFMRLFADHYLSRVASLGSPGIDELRRPVLSYDHPGVEGQRHLEQVAPAPQDRSPGSAG